MRDELGAPKVVDRSTFHAELDAWRVREKAHTREGDAIAAARRRLPMVEIDGATPLIGERATRRPAGQNERKVRILTVPMAPGRDRLGSAVPSPSGLACRPGIRTTWERAGAEPRLPIPRPRAQKSRRGGLHISRRNGDASTIRIEAHG